MRFTSRVVIRAGCRGGTKRYAGYHELSYLSPDNFVPNKKVAVESGLAEHGRNFLVRVVAWKASHDLNESGWSLEVLRDVVAHLATLGHVLISSEEPLPANLKPFAYSGRVSDIHHVLANVDLLVGESATMAS